MTNRAWTGLGLAALAAAGLAYYALSNRADKIPAKAFEDMTFSDDFDQVTGDENGILSHQVVLRTPNGKERTLPCHLILGEDFRKLTPAQKREVVKGHTRRDAEAEGLACLDPEGREFFRPAYGQSDDDEFRHHGGGGCTTKTCAAHVAIGGNCEVGGVNCARTVICCGPCPPGC